MKFVTRGLILFVSASTATDSNIKQSLNIPNYDRYEDNFNNGFSEGALVLSPTPALVAHFSILLASKAEEDLCATDSVNELRLVRNSGRLTAGEVRVGEKTSLYYIYISFESEFMYIPGKDYDAIVGKLSIDPSLEIEKPIEFAASKVTSLPQIYVQFSKTQNSYVISPQAYSLCEPESVPEDKRKCILLIKRSKMDNHLILGRPFVNHVVSIINVGSTTPFYKMCIPKYLKTHVSASKSDRVVAMPWNANDYLMLVGLILLVIIVLLFFFGEQIRCWDRKRPRRSVPRSVQPAVVTANEQEEATQPLIINNTNA
jgi:hypothetical protein